MNKVAFQNITQTINVLGINHINILYVKRNGKKSRDLIKSNF